MPTYGYQEAVEDLKHATRDMHRAIVSLTEELEAIDWYNQRIDVCSDEDLKHILTHNRDEEKEHAAMLTEWIRHHDQVFAHEMQHNLFVDGTPAQTDTPA